MQFTIHQLPKRPDVERIAAALTDADPAAVVDFDPVASALRLSTSLGAADVVQVLAIAGLPVEPVDLRRQPSECCGGCGG